MSLEDLFDDVLPVTLVLERSPTSLGSTPIEASGVVGTATAAAQSKSQIDPSVITCTVCKSVLKTKSGFSRHVTIHKINDYNSRKPLEEEIKQNLPEYFEAINQKIESEPAVGEMGAQKRDLAKALSTGIGTSAVTSALQDIISPYVINCVLVKTKVMPPAQFEDALKSLNHLLANGEFYEKATSKLLCVLPLDRIPTSPVMNRMIWRISSELTFKIQEFIFKQMKKRHDIAHENFVMNDNDTEIFKIHIGDMLRAVYKFGYQSNNNVWKMRCQCLSERFIVCSDPVSDLEFLDRKLWHENVISLSNACFSMFLGFERIMNHLQSTGSPCTADSVFECISNLDNIVILCDMRQLSQGMMLENVAFDFVKDRIRSLTAVSGKSHARKTLDKLRKKQHAPTVSTRTNLKRDTKRKSVPSSSPSTSKETRGKIPTDMRKKTTHEKPSGRAKSKRTEGGQKKSSQKKKSSAPSPSASLKVPKRKVASQRKDIVTPSTSQKRKPPQRESGDSSNIQVRRSSRQRAQRDDKV